jgi:hypothetical protein
MTISKKSHLALVHDAEKPSPVPEKIMPNRVNGYCDEGYR